MKSGVYIHIPFCEQRCYYCAFTVAVAPEQKYEPYVRRVISEIELSGITHDLQTIFFGGGTPSIMDGGLIERIVGALPAGAEEITIECNPGTLTETKLDVYRRAGVNRISLGAQSFHDEDLRNAGRLHASADVFRDLDLLRGHGFKNINVDLIAGLPNQRIEIWRHNLDWIERLKPEHVSIYMLDAEERSVWARRLCEFPDDEVFAKFYREAVERLERSGYHHYEISNFAQPGFECRHNLNCWTGEPYRGFGVSAHSFSGSRRFWNTSSLREYAEMLDGGRLPLSGEEELTREMRLEEAFMLGLRQTSGFDVWRVAQDLNFRYPPEWFDKVGELEDAGWIQFDGKVLKLTSAGCLIATSVTGELLWPTLLSTSEATR